MFDVSSQTPANVSQVSNGWSVSPEKCGTSGDAIATDYAPVLTQAPLNFLRFAVVSTMLATSGAWAANQPSHETLASAYRDLDDFELGGLGAMSWSQSASLVDAASEGGTHTDEVSALTTEIISYGFLPHGWDGEDTNAPSKAAVADAISFIDLLPIAARLPRPMVAGDGEVGFYWKTDDGYIDVGFYGDGRIRYYAISNKAGLETQDVATYNRRSLPTDLLEVIAHI